MKMNKRILYPLLLLLTLLLGEVYLLFPNTYVNWFYISKIIQQISWYIRDTGEGLTWITFLFVWYIRERQRNDKFWSWLIFLFLLFRTTDLGIYWINHRHAGYIYGICYLIIIVYGSIGTGKEYKKYKNQKK